MKTFRKKSELPCVLRLKAWISTSQVTIPKESRRAYKRSLFP
jgi:hypothetical protein